MSVMLRDQARKIDSASSELGIVLHVTRHAKPQLCQINCKGLHTPQRVRL